MPTDVTPPPVELRSDRLVVRCWQPTDAPLLKEAIDASLEHLREWMPWAHDEPTSVEQKVALLRGFRGRFDLGDDFVYGILDAEQSRALGGCGLHPRGGPRSLEIGYWVRADAVRQGIATEVTTMLAHAAFRASGVERLDVLVEPGNAASAAIPRRLGFVEEGTLRHRLQPHDPAEPLRDALVFTMLREEFDASPMRTFELRAFDVTGGEVELD
jgi:RimJ/RimL family protein N-acetyltransferase